MLVKVAATVAAMLTESSYDRRSMSSSDRAEFQPSKLDYAHVTLLLLAVTVALFTVVLRSDPAQRPASALLAPIFALVGLTALVWLAMVIVRNTAVLRGSVSAQYFVSFADNVPEEWLERPARTFNNLMQVPVLFYVVCLLMMVTERLDSAQTTLAWIFVGARLLHAFVYIVSNNVKYRFACWMAGCITLIFLWARFARMASG